MKIYQIQIQLQNMSTTKNERQEGESKFDYIKRKQATYHEFRKEYYKSYHRLNAFCVATFSEYAMLHDQHKALNSVRIGLQEQKEAAWNKRKQFKEQKKSGADDYEYRAKLNRLMKEAAITTHEFKQTVAANDRVQADYLAQMLEFRDTSTHSELVALRDECDRRNLVYLSAYDEWCSAYAR